MVLRRRSMRNGGFGQDDGPRDARHESRPSTTFGQHPPTIPFSANTKSQVDGLLFLRNPGHGRQVGVKRSRWAGFVAAASPKASKIALIRIPIRRTTIRALASVADWFPR